MSDCRRRALLGFCKVRVSRHKERGVTWRHRRQKEEEVKIVTANLTAFFLLSLKLLALLLPRKH
ncbi:hypothetical protein [Fischerella sp. JS2]|uniref:hypothetical protein n=1 Tax=Fischerella sp. JS2 TaxID=2597771 RepID=UPI0028E614B2|nr:hypothetical protein [Fischerella sp. JS2]